MNRLKIYTNGIFFQNDRFLIEINQNNLVDKNTIFGIQN